MSDDSQQTDKTTSESGELSVNDLDPKPVEAAAAEQVKGGFGQLRNAAATSSSAASKGGSGETSSQATP